MRKQVWLAICLLALLAIASICIVVVAFPGAETRPEDGPRQPATVVGDEIPFKPEW